MIRREDYIFVIGYDGNTAIVNAASKKKYGRLTTQELAAQGMYKPALCSALYNGSAEEMNAVLEKYNETAFSTSQSVDELKRIFGVAEIPKEVTKVSYL